MWHHIKDMEVWCSNKVVTLAKPKKTTDYLNDFEKWLKYKTTS